MVDRFKIKLTKDNFLKGTPSDDRCCAIALRVKEEFPDAECVSVDLDNIRIADKNNFIHEFYPTQLIHEEIVEKFDKTYYPSKPVSKSIVQTRQQYKDYLKAWENAKNKKIALWESVKDEELEYVKGLIYEDEFI